MKVAIFLGSGIAPSTGGNFSYHEKFIRSIDDHNFNNDLEICFVGRLHPSKIGLKKKYHRIAPLFTYKFFRLLEKLYITKIFSALFFTNTDLNNRWDISVLQKNKIDLVVFPKQFLREIVNFPFVTMNWDAGHKCTYAFPELLENYEAREKWYRVDMQKSISIFVESESSKEEFAHFFAIPENKIEIVPLFAGGVVDMTVSDDEQKQLLSTLGLEKLSYFYYPAQFWAHKNHYNLILAFKRLISEKSADKKLVLSGSDKGNKQYIVTLIEALGLRESVKVLGFISNEEVYTLYKNSIALVMPTFLGPTNMPLLEATSLQTAVICSDLKGHREMCKEGALYADPANPAKWFEAMEALLNDEYRLKLIALSEQIRRSSVFNIDSAVKKFEEALIKIIPVRKTFN